MIMSWLVYYLPKFKSEIGNKMVFPLILSVLIMVSSSSTAEDGLLSSILKDRLINGSGIYIKTAICISQSLAKVISSKFLKMLLEMDR